MADRIEEIVCEELFEPGQIDKDWVRAQIAAELSRKVEAEKSWPAVTDCDRLDAVFVELNQRGVIALQNAGFTQSDGYSDAIEVYHEQGGEDSGQVGYCFYHGQDLERVVQGDDLYLAFGAIDGNDEKGVEIGKLICEVLKKGNFTVAWDGSIKSRIVVKGIHWQRRFQG